MPEQYPLMVPGASSASADFEDNAPYDRALIATVATADEAAAETALTTAHGLFRDRDSWLAPWKRVDILERTIEIMTERADYLALESAREGGKPLADSQHEVSRAIDGVKLCVEALRNQAGSEIPMNISRSSGQPAGLYHPRADRRRGRGERVQHPLNLIIHQVGPAVAAGCPGDRQARGDHAAGLPSLRADPARGRLARRMVPARHPRRDVDRDQAGDRSAHRVSSALSAAPGSAGCCAPSSRPAPAARSNMAA